MDSITNAITSVSCLHLVCLPVSAFSKACNYKMEFCQTRVSSPHLRNYEECKFDDAKASRESRDFYLFDRMDF